MNTIKINGVEKLINSLVRGVDLYTLAKVSSPDKLFFDIKNEVDIPIAQDDYVILVGDENITVGQADIPDNPNLKQKISVNLNGENIAIHTAKITGQEIRKNDTAIGNNSWLYADLKNSSDQKIEDNFRLIIKNKDCFITIPASGDNIVDIEECAKHGRKPPKKQSKYKIKIDGKKYTADTYHLLGAKILDLAGKTSQNFGLQQKFKGGNRKTIEPSQKVDLATPGVERFETIPKNIQQG